MPIVSVFKDDLEERLGKAYTQEQFEDLCFDFGIELDDVTSEYERILKEQGKFAAEGKSKRKEYKIDIPANRYDLLCLEGLCKSLRIFLGLDPPASYKVESSGLRLVVKKETAKIRKFCVAAVLKDIRFTEQSYKSFIDLQEKLHQNICRERTLVAIGTHDLDTLNAPFSYEALPPQDIEFIPLKEKNPFKADKLLDYYDDEKNMSKIGKYTHIIKSSSVYPVIYDSKRVVLSLPPIINGEHSKITLNTRNVFIECTATDLTKANIVLNIMTTMFSGYCSSIQTVEIVYEANPKEVITTPDLSERTFKTSLSYLNRAIGIKISAEKVIDLLKRMELQAVLEKDGDTFTVVIPATRSDILNECDIEEDVAIAYGYNNVKKTVPNTLTVGKQLPINALTDHIREGVAQAGFVEVLTWALISKKDMFTNMLMDIQPWVSLPKDSAKASEFEGVRTSLIPSLLKTLSFNKAKVQLPVHLFEASDVCLLDEKADTGSRNERRLAALYSGRTAGFEVVHGLLDRIMQLNNVPFHLDEVKAPEITYELEEGIPNQTPYFMPSLQARIFVKSKKNGIKQVGVMGVLHPQVLSNFGISTPCSVLELNIECFL